MPKSILVIGGYGGVGKELVRGLLQYTSCNVIIGGRNVYKAQELKNWLFKEFPNANLQTIHLDATDKASLLNAFKEVDLAIITATIPDYIDLLAESALETQTDLMDILVRGDVVDKFLKYKQQIIENNRIFITQCGFHPGLITPFIRLAKSNFDVYQTAAVGMAMDAVFEQPESVKEILYEVMESNSMILEKGEWRKANYKDAKNFLLSNKFGEKVCFPLQMRELMGLEKELGLTKCGVYAAGFSPYIDNFIFPLTMFLGFINKKLSLNICSWLFFRAIRGNLAMKPRVEMQLVASGSKDGENKMIKMKLESNNGFDLTAKAVIALLKQYLAGMISKPDLYLMGKISEEEQLFRDLKNMGIEIEKK